MFGPKVMATATLCSTAAWVTDTVMEDMEDTATAMKGTEDMATEDMATATINMDTEVTDTVMEDTRIRIVKVRQHFCPNIDVLKEHDAEPFYCSSSDELQRPGEGSSKQILQGETIHTYSNIIFK